MITKSLDKKNFISDRFRIFHDTVNLSYFPKASASWIFKNENRRGDEGTQFIVMSIKLPLYFSHVTKEE